MTSLTINTGHNLTKAWALRGFSSSSSSITEIDRISHSSVSLWRVALIRQDEAQIRFRDHISIIHAPVFLGTCIHDVYTTRSGKNWSTFSWGQLSCGANGFWISGSSWDRQQGNDHLQLLEAESSFNRSPCVDIYILWLVMFCSCMGRMTIIHRWIETSFSCGSKCKWTPFGGGAL